MYFCLFLQALDTFNTAIVSPIYYVMFTTLTILASVIMFKVILVLHLYISSSFLGSDILPSCSSSTWL
jgi:hypothetical protein